MQPNTYKLAVATAEGTYYYSPEDIVRLKASSSYTHIYLTNKKKLLISKVLKEFAIQLEPLGFVRTHRSHLVNRRYILFVNASGNAVMKDESVAEISRRMKPAVMKTLNYHN